MLCDICFNMLRGQDGKVWRGTYDLHFNHSTTVRNLRRSANLHCGICRVLFEELDSKLSPQPGRQSEHIWSASPPLVDWLISFVNILQTYWMFVAIWRLSSLLPKSLTRGPAPEQSTPAPVADAFEEIPVTRKTSLSVIDYKGIKDGKLEQLYCLDNKLRCGQVRCRRIFVLKQTTDSSEPNFRTPISRNTSSDEVYQLVRQWMSRCTCVDTSVKSPSWYPSRLINLEELKKLNYLDKNTLESKKELNSHKATIKVKLEEMDQNNWQHGPGHPNTSYVTLSHCWGQTVSPRHQLTEDNIAAFKAGLKLHELPKTFRQAIEFAARLPCVGYIWIDSLCIKQGDEIDWLEQSASMEKIYSETFLNISATDSSNSEEGLYRARDPELLLEDEVILNITGLPGADKRVLTTSMSTTPLTESNAVPSGKELPPKLADTSAKLTQNHLRRCTILDVSFWTDRIDRAPVNRRGWVLQERLMAPRVLHFCKDQVAWECREFDAAEGQPQDLPNFHLTSHGIVEESRLKGVDVNIDGKRLRHLRLQGMRDPDMHLQPQIYAFELWRRIVEVYSLTAITRSEDKLIALSGLARWMSREIGGAKVVAQLSRPEQNVKESPGVMTQTSEYVAGLWALHLPSQLLWSVEPVFRELDNTFEHLSTAPSTYRAPSFSWASINANTGHGIRYADVTDQDLFINVEQVSINPRKGSDSFGIIQDASLVLRGKLRKALLLQDPKRKGRFEWRLRERDYLDEEEHRNVYLDCLERDKDTVFGPDANIFVVPAASGERVATKSSKYLICLILQLMKDEKRGNVFRRIGLTKLSTWADSQALQDHAILQVYESDVNMPHSGGYNPTTGLFSPQTNY